MTDRRSVLTMLGASALLGLPKLGYAGAQIEEPLADAVRNAMSAAVSSGDPPEPVFADTEARLHYLRWKVEMNTRAPSICCCVAPLNAISESVNVNPSISHGSAR